MTKPAPPPTYFDVQIFNKKTAAMKVLLSGLEPFFDPDLLVKLLAYHSTAKSPHSIIIAIGVLYCTSGPLVHAARCLMTLQTIARTRKKSISWLEQLRWLLVAAGRSSKPLVPLYLCYEADSD